MVSVPPHCPNWATVPGVPVGAELVVVEVEEDLVVEEGYKIELISTWSIDLES
jgi:hypothetical protein